MKTRTRRHLYASVLISLLAVLTGCTTLNRQPPATISEAIDTEEAIAELSPAIEELYLSWREFNEIYKDIKFLERGFLFDPHDRQLGYIQKTALYVQDASVRTGHIWERLSVLHYVRADKMRDYLVLSVNALTEAIDEIGYDDRFIDIYTAFIDHAAIQGDLRRARNQLADIATTLKKMRKKIAAMIR